MRWKGLIAAPLVAALVTALSATAAPDPLPEGWRRTGAATPQECTVHAAPVRDGPTPKAFVIECAKDVKNFSALGQWISAQDYAGHRVRLSAQMRVNDVGDWAGLWLRADATQTPIAFENMVHRPMKGTLGWQRVEIVLDIPQHADTVVIGSLLTGAGRMESTMYALEIVPKTVPLTKVAAAPPQSTRPLNVSPP